MSQLTLEQAEKIIDGALARGRELGCHPLCVVVLDASGHTVALKRQDGASFFRADVALGKAWGAVAMGAPSRELGIRAKTNPAFYHTLAATAQGKLLPQIGGVLVKAADGTIIGAAGISGDSGERDEACAIAGVKSAGLTADPAEPIA